MSTLYTCLKMYGVVGLAEYMVHTFSFLINYNKKFSEGDTNKHN